ncbi:MAG: hypothetical protein COA50_01205 [Flavobacteriaceae bacterium]|nr:MAG: hypothetical protein COA50_01205 [Flavobacteriaceae bacterium]
MKHTSQQVTSFHLMQPLRKNKNLLEVPNLSHTPVQFHGLYSTIRQNQHIKKFEQHLSGTRIYLQLFLADGLICHTALNRRLANMFYSHSAVITFHENFLIVELQIK